MSSRLWDHCTHWFSFVNWSLVNQLTLIYLHRKMYSFSLFFQSKFISVSQTVHFSNHPKLLWIFSNWQYLFFVLYLHFLFPIIFKLWHYPNEILCMLLLIQFLFSVAVKHLLKFYQHKEHLIQICTAIIFYCYYWKYCLYHYLK
jgi:hypothetical protein